MRVATHPGNFHADDVFAIAVLRLAHGRFELVRTRDTAVYDACDIRVDVGGRNDPRTGDYDHHQRGGAGERPNGIRYASFGLVWRAHGEALAGSPEAAAALDARLVAGVDANDTGQTITEPLVPDVWPMTVSGIVAALNPAWDEELTAEQEDARFEEAVALATGILERQIAGSAAWQRARRLVGDAVAGAADPRLVELERNMPWREIVVTTAPEARFVLYPKSEGWGVQAVPRELGEFANRVDFPAEWAGHSGAELAQASGVPDAIFCHPAGFYASAGSREGVLALARGALEAAGETT